MGQVGAAATSRRGGTVVRWLRIFAVTGALALCLMGCVAAPGYGYARTAVVVGGPQVAFTFSDGVEGYYEPAYGAYVYGDGGYYYRWVGNDWVYANYYGGPWQPVVATVYLPPLLAFGPPPPIVGYRPYFVWWRLHEAHWYAVNHPHWWYRHRMYVRHYALWHEHVVRFYARHPAQRPGMRPLFHARERRFDHARLRQRRAAQENRFRRAPRRFHPRPLRGHPYRGHPYRGHPYHGPRPAQRRHGHP